MFKKTITYTDYNDVERTEDFYFNISKAEFQEMELEVPGGYTNMLKQIVDAKDIPTLVSIFKDLILRSYGEKSLDGKHFYKSDEIRNNFKSTEAYVELYMELSTDDNAASDFVNGVFPKNIENKDLAK